LLRTRGGATTADEEEIAQVVAASAGLEDDQAVAEATFQAEADVRGRTKVSVDLPDLGPAGAAAESGIPGGKA